MGERGVEPSQKAGFYHAGTVPQQGPITPGGNLRGENGKFKRRRTPPSGLMRGEETCRILRHTLVAHFEVHVWTRGAAGTA
jgi:hypothetical protein